MLADNHTLVFLGTWLYKLKLTNQRPSCLSVDLLYDYEKISRDSLQWGMVEHNAVKYAFSIPKNFFQ